MSKLWMCIKFRMDETLISPSFTSGFRVGEINTLRSRDVNLEKGHIHVGCTIARGKKYRNFVKPSPKTIAGVRDVPIPKKLRPILQHAMAEIVFKNMTRASRF